MANVGNVVRLIAIKGTHEGVNEASAAVANLAKQYGGVAVETEKVSKGSISVETAWRRQTLALDETARAQDKMARATKVANDALAQGLTTQAEVTRHLDLQAQKLGLVDAAARKMITGMTAAGDAGAVASQKMVAGMTAASAAAEQAAKAVSLARTTASESRLVTGMSAAGDVNAVASQRMLAGMSTGGAQAAQGIGLARHELVNLGRQAQDVGVQLVSGQSPFMILAQQGTQIADVFIASGKSVGSFFTQAIGWGTRFLSSTAGIVTGIAAIGAVAVYAAAQFVRASTTVEQALENQNRLLKEGKALIDQRTSAEARAQLNPRDLTEFEIKRNLLDLQRKLNEEARGALIRTAPRPNIGGDIRGEFAGEAPLTPGMEKIIDATDKLKAAQAAGLPGMKEYNAELGRIGTAHPELAKTVDKMIELGRTGIELENAEMRLRAISDAMAGVATNAQLAAVGLGSIAQFKLTNLQGKEAAEATERQAVATLRIAQLYPGMSIEGTKLADAASRQLEMAQAIGPMAQIEVQHKQRTAELTDKLGEAEGTRIANAERAVKLAEIESQHTLTMIQLRGQLNVAQAVTGSQRINAQYAATIDLLTEQIGPQKALEQADKQRAISIAEANTNARQMLKNLQNEGELIRASDGAEQDRIKARQTYQKLIDDNVDSTLAAAVASKQLRNAEEERSKAEIEAADNALKHINTAADAWAAYKDGLISWSVANDEAAKSILRTEAAAEDAAFALNSMASSMFEAGQAALLANTAFIPFATTWKSMGPTSLGTGGMYQGPQGLTQFKPGGYTSSAGGVMEMTAIVRSIYGEGGFDPVTGAPTAQGLEFQFNKMLTAAGGNLGAAVNNMLSGGIMTAGALGAPPTVDQDRLGILSRAIDLLPKEQQAGSIQQLVGQLQAAPGSLQTAELIKQLNEKLEQLAQATDANTSATSAMTDVLSPFYSSDPRRTHLGFRAFAEGGIMTQYGELPLRQYQGGGMATSPQVAVFGEGSTPEAYVPVPSGRIPVEIKQPANSNQRPVNVNIYVQGNADQNTVAAMKATAFQQAQAMRRAIG